MQADGQLLRIERSEFLPIMPSKLDTDLIKKAFSIMGRYLSDRKTLGEIAVYGGSAIMLQFEWMRKGTNDVDAVIRSQGNHGAVQAAADEAARQLGLARSWLSESVTMYTSKNEKPVDFVAAGMYPNYIRPGLRVIAASPQYMLAMKMLAFERTTSDDRDFWDAVALGKVIGIRGERELKELIAAYFDEDESPVATEVRLEELARAIVADKGRP